MKDKIGSGKQHYSILSIVASILVIFLFVAIILSFYTMLYSETRQKIIKIGELNAVTAAEQIDQYLTKGVETMKLACYTLDSMIKGGKSQEEIHDFLVNQSDAIRDTTSEKSTGMYGYINGEYLDGTEWVPEDDYEPTERPWYIDAIANVGRVSVVDPYIDAQTNTVMITFSKTLCDAKSVAAMDFSIDRLQIITEEISENDESDFEIVLDSNYRVIAHSDKSEIGKEYLTEEDTFGNELVKELRDSEEVFFSFRYKGAEYIAYAVNVSNDWFCISVFDATSEFSQLKYMLIFTVVALVIVVTILLIIMARSHKKHEQFRKLSIHVVESLAAAIDAKDPYTNGHSGRVADYTKEISRRCGWNEKQQNDIYMMGLLHDVGKIGIPDAVINKPGKLTKEEFDTIKGHPAIGADILSKAKEMHGLITGAHWHHERFDGSGYPDGLSGFDIPEEARIIAVADAYDAMTSNRSYRDALPQDEVREEIEKGRGTQFDPKYADIMLKMIDEDKDYNMRGH